MKSAPLGKSNIISTASQGGKLIPEIQIRRKLKLSIVSPIVSPTAIRQMRQIQNKMFRQSPETNGRPK